MEYPKKLKFESTHTNGIVFLRPPTVREIDGRLIRDDGNVLQFHDGICVCEDPETIKLAIESGLFGKEYSSIEYSMMVQNQKNERVKDEAPADTVKPKRNTDKKI